MSQKPTKRSPATRALRLFILTVAVGLPLYSIGVWMYQVAPIYRGAAPVVVTVLYLPARILGLVGFVLMFYQFVLSARFSFMESAFTRMELVRKHKTIGKLGFLAILLHGTAMLAYDLFTAGEIWLDLPKTMGLVALVLLSVAVAVAIYWKPLGLSNKQWMRIHRLAYLVFPLAFYHGITLGSTLNTSRPLLGLFYGMTAIYLVILVRRVRKAVSESRRGRKT